MLRNLKLLNLSNVILPIKSASWVNSQLLGLTDIECKVVVLIAFIQIINFPPELQLIVTCYTSNYSGVISKY